MGQTPDAFPIQEYLKRVPREPGCYLMKDRQGTIIYIGKARNLRARIRSYFGKTSDTRFFVGLLDQVLGDIETILTSNEKEAILLENQLIKEHMPRFNVELKDGRSFLHLRIDRTTPFPRIEIVRRPRKRDQALHFGPYASPNAIRGTLRVLNRHFLLRTCPDSVFKNRSRPCLEHQIGRCPAPCVLPVDPEEYGRSLEEVILFLSGKTGDLVRTLETRMLEASNTQEYEKAGHFRDQITAIQETMTRQHVAMRRELDVDVIGLHRSGPQVTLQVLEIRGGVLLGSHAIHLGRQALPDEVILESFIPLRYEDSPIPDAVLTPLKLDFESALSDVLSEKRGRKVRVEAPQRGERFQLIRMAEKNAAQSFALREQKEADAAHSLEELNQLLRLTSFPMRIECYDISNIQGSEAVASMVCFLAGEPAKREYRTYRMQAPASPDDFKMMYEVIHRRFKRAREGGDRPNLVVIDGGKGQVNAAHRALLDLGIVGVDLMGLAKSRVQDPASRSGTTPERSPERVFMQGARDPLVLPRNSAALHLLTRLRDEAHRFAINYHRKLRRKRILKSPLDSIKGVGPARRKRLLKHFGSLKRIRSADPRSIARVQGISEELAAHIASALQKTSKTH